MCEYGAWLVRDYGNMEYVSIVTSSFTQWHETMDLSPQCTRYKPAMRNFALVTAFMELAVPDLVWIQGEVDPVALGFYEVSLYSV